MNKQIDNTDHNIQDSISHDGKYLTFSLGKEEYGISIHKVREIIALIDITEMPKMPDYVKGVINLRGKVSPVIDLRMKFSMELTKYTARTCIVLVEIDKGNTTALMGMIVDHVSEVVNMTDDSIEKPPEVSEVDTGYILGIAKKESNIIMLLDIDKVMNSGELDLLDAAA